MLCINPNFQLITPVIYFLKPKKNQKKTNKQNTTSSLNNTESIEKQVSKDSSGFVADATSEKLFRLKRIEHVFLMTNGVLDFYSSSTFISFSEHKGKNDFSLP